MEYDISCPHSTVISRLEDLFVSGKHSDVTLVVGKGDDKRHFCMHKTILASASEVFTAMFYGPVKHTEDEISLPEDPPQAFESLLMFIYSGKCQTGLQLSEVIELALLADKYLITDLKNKCIEYFLNDVLCEETACQMYEVACSLGDPSFRDLCLFTLISRVDTVITTPAFLEAKPSTIQCIVEQNFLNLQTGEASLLKAIISWSKLECERQGMTVDSKNILDIIQPFLPYVNVSSSGASGLFDSLQDSLLSREELRKLLDKIHVDKNLCGWKLNRRFRLIMNEVKLGNKVSKEITISEVSIQIRVVSTGDILLDSFQCSIIHQISTPVSMKLAITRVSDRAYILKNRTCTADVEDMCRCICFKTPYPILLQSGGVYEVTCKEINPPLRVIEINPTLFKSEYLQVVNNRLQPISCIESFSIYPLVEC